mmetsp:Transcript_28238/g.72035  ORF Transcript_28238/g.72035 Transcript_28238/m.72035 type:complete len:253 (-) Transcript_28238:250-1008(-)|eukprot:CAMPEP_0113910882 /NCGR_PEP_ID=MMETSP0780_2-20120614/27816_1 /TAXON_ID=652834 /ORGANISM="Palpitomonas bilix" /LENGTH=252 /DNA_ID=CAMNT_0000907175 /DNA_START=300 /DNA_END=1058 /DNA_ORIENTATION=+ /assembly_acc=CAM_ASM_000599
MAGFRKGSLVVLAFGAVVTGASVAASFAYLVIAFMSTDAVEVTEQINTLYYSLGSLALGIATLSCVSALRKEYALAAFQIRERKQRSSTWFVGSTHWLPILLEHRYWGSLAFFSFLFVPLGLTSGISFVVAKRFNTGAWAILWAVLSVIIFACCYSYAETKALLRRGALHEAFVVNHYDENFSPREADLDDLLDADTKERESGCSKRKLKSLIKSLLMGFLYTVYLVFGMILTIEAITYAVAAGKGSNAIYL